VRVCYGVWAAAVGSTCDPQEGTQNYSCGDCRNLVSKCASYSDYNYKGDASIARADCSNTALKPHVVYQLTAGGATLQYWYDATGNLTSATNSGFDTVTWWAMIWQANGKAGTRSSVYISSGSEALWISDSNPDLLSAMLDSAEKTR